MKKEKNNIYVRKSCLTGKVVHICFAPSRSAARQSYFRAKKAELKLVRQYDNNANKRRKRMLEMLNECLNEIPITEPLSKEIQEAAKRFRKLIDENLSFDREFINHITEETKRQNENKKIWKQMRERKKIQN